MTTQSNSTRHLAKRFELVSDYRKRLNKIVDINIEYDAKIAEIVAPKKYFEKSADLTESEQLKIIFKILTEQEESLNQRSYMLKKSWT